MIIKRKNLKILIENYLFEGKYPYLDDQETSDEFRQWMLDNRSKEAASIKNSSGKRKPITDATGSTKFSGLQIAYEKYGKDFEQDRSYYGLGSYFPDYGEEGSKEDVEEEKDEKIVYDSNMPSKYKLADPSGLIKGRETFVINCSETGCAQWVGSIAGWQGNAWHEHWHSEVVSSAFFNIKAILKDLTYQFNATNKSPKEKSRESSIKGIVKKIIPPKSNFKDVPLGSVVGLYYPKSKNFTKAFFEGATGSRGMGTQFDWSDPAGETGFFETEDGKPWSPELLKQSIKFRPTDKLMSGKGFGMNTHLGYVGAQIDGEPIIFHNIGAAAGGKEGRVYATPFKSLSTSRLMILWYKKPSSGWFDWLF